MTVIGYDAIHVNASAIPSNAKVVAGYDTGTADIKWTPDDWARFPSARHVHIDQGFGNAFVRTANVIDVERGAYSPAQVRKWIEVNETGDPAVYCNQSTLPLVLNTGYRGNVWLARITTQEPVVPVTVKGCTVVAQQFEFKTAFDVSAVFSDEWPKSGGKMSVSQFDAPSGLRRVTTVAVEWQDVPAVNGEAPTGYHVEAIEMNGNTFTSFDTPVAYAEIPHVPVGWTLTVRVWANGGSIAPPNSEIEIHV